MLTKMSAEETFHTTIQFKDILGTFEEFVEECNNYIITPIVYDIDLSQEKIYRALYNNFCNCNIAYDTVDSFLRHFFLTYWDSVEEYSAVFKMIRRIRNLSLDEITSGSISVMNKALNDNAKTDNPLSDIIPYITSQLTSRQYMNKTVAYYQALTSYRNNKLGEFINKFKKHFLFVFEKETDIYRG